MPVHIACAQRVALTRLRDPSAEQLAELGNHFRADLAFQGAQLADQARVEALSGNGSVVLSVPREQRADGQRRPLRGVAIVRPSLRQEGDRYPCNDRRGDSIPGLGRRAALVEDDGDVQEHRGARDPGVLVRGARQHWLDGLQHELTLVEDGISVSLVDEQIRKVSGTAQSQRTTGVGGQEPDHLRDVRGASVGALEVIRALRVHEEEPPQVDDGEQLVVGPLLQLDVDHLLLAVAELSTHEV
mmetsp:Transcript_43324/g.87340  ORF Transcript_43324/g.87340 Transcript_43324/m.87340 type:complete len:243 (+) Transcript_43324:57-785(+)